MKAPCCRLWIGARASFYRRAGAYNVTQWMQFIEYRPHVVLVGEDGGVDIIREAEDWSDFARRERLPERLILSAPGQTAESETYESPADEFFQHAGQWGKWSAQSNTISIFQ